MIKKVIGTILVVAAVVVAVLLFIGGRLIFPHVTGPIVLAVIGLIFLTRKASAGHLEK